MEKHKRGKEGAGGSARHKKWNDTADSRNSEVRWDKESTQDKEDVTRI